MASIPKLTTEPETKDDTDPPEIRAYSSNRREAWSTLAGAFLLQFCIVGPVMSFGVFQDFYSTDFLKSYSASNISWIGSLQPFLYLGCGVIGGKLYDSGYCRTTLFCGSFIYLLSLFMVSIAKPEHYYQVLLSQGLGMGLGTSLVYVPTFTLVSQHFRTRKGLAMGILSASSPLGTIVFTIMLNRMIHRGPGFPWAIRICAFFITGCFAAVYFLITFLPTSAIPSQPGHKLFQSLAAPPYLLSLAAGFTAQLGTLFPTFYLQTFAENHNFSKSFVFYAPVIMNVATIFGRIIPGFLADRLGSLQVYIACVCANGIVSFLMLAAGNKAGLILFSIFFGFFFGSTIGLYLPVVAALVPHEADMGRIMGIALLPVGISSLIGPPIAGVILGSGLIWWKAIIFSGSAMVSASILLGIALFFHTHCHRF